MQTPASSTIADCPRMSDWKGIPGHPCWIQIPAVDLKRAANFYKSVLGLNMRTEEPQADGDIKMFHFTFPGGSLETCLSGGVVPRDKAWPQPLETGPATVYFYVEDLEGTMEMVEKAGGKALTTRNGAGETGWCADFRDTEGNIHGVYTLTPKA